MKEFGKWLVEHEGEYDVIPYEILDSWDEPIGEE